MDLEALEQKSREILLDIRAWRRAHPRVTFVEMEDEIHRRMINGKPKCFKRRPSRVKRESGEKEQSSQRLSAPPVPSPCKAEASISAGCRAMEENG